MSTPMPCGTVAAYRRHTRRGETPCEPCRNASNNHARTRRRAKGVGPRDCNQSPTKVLIEEILFLINAGEGTARILAATGYTGREKTFRARLVKAGHQDLANRILNPWELAA